MWFSKRGFLVALVIPPASQRSSMLQLQPSFPSWPKQLPVDPFPTMFLVFVIPLLGSRNCKSISSVLVLTVRGLSNLRFTTSLRGLIPHSYRPATNPWLHFFVSWPAWRSCMYRFQFLWKWGCLFNTKFRWNFISHSLVLILVRTIQGTQLYSSGFNASYIPKSLESLCLLRTSGLSDYSFEKALSLDESSGLVNLRHLYVHLSESKNKFRFLNAFFSEFFISESCDDKMIPFSHTVWLVFRILRNNKIERNFKRLFVPQLLSLLVHTNEDPNWPSRYIEEELTETFFDFPASFPNIQLL